MSKSLPRSETSGFALNRRQFMAGATATTAAGLILPKGARAQSPKSGGTLRIGMSGGSTSDGTDPMLFAVAVGRNYSYATFDTLVELAPTGELIPCLAES